MPHAFVLLALGVLMDPSVRQDAPVRTVPSVDLERYAGEWHEAARLPNL